MPYKEWGLTVNFNKPDQKFHMDIKENETIKLVQNFKYLGVSLNKKNV